MNFSASPNEFFRFDSIAAESTNSIQGEQKNDTKYNTANTNANRSARTTSLRARISILKLL